MTHENDIQRPIQRRNKFSFLVVWPSGESYRCFYPTLDAADLAARGFEMEGAVVVP